MHHMPSTIAMTYSDYFSGKWSDASLDTYQFSGWNLIDKVNSLNPDRVLDIGCGFNRFKGKINNLVGIDPYNDCADCKCSVEEYDGPPADVVLCLGSINFGDEETIDHQLEIVDSLFTKYAFFRVNPGIAHSWSADWKDIIWFKWTVEKIHQVSKKYKYNLTTLEEEKTLQGDQRYYFEFSK